MMTQPSWYLGLILFLLSAAVPAVLAIAIANSRRYWRAFSIGAILPSALGFRSVALAFTMQLDECLSNQRYVDAFDFGPLCSERSQLMTMWCLVIIMGCASMAAQRAIWGKNGCK